MENADRGTSALQFLTFHVGENEYAVGILNVREIIPCETITPVPTTPAFLRGVVNLRGSALPVVDLAAKFGLPETPVTRASCIVITEVAVCDTPTAMGLLVDSVSQVLELAPDSIREVPPFGPAVRLDYLAGMVEIGDGFVLVLDLPRVLSAEELLTVASIDDLRQALALAAAAASEAPAPEASAPARAPAARRRRRDG